jgi:hypothetical protein
MLMMHVIVHDFIKPLGARVFAATEQYWENRGKCPSMVLE